MKNLRHLCTYHCGTPQEKVFKITASFLVIFSMVLASGGTDWSRAAELEANVVADTGAPSAPLPPMVVSPMSVTTVPGTATSTNMVMPVPTMAVPFNNEAEKLQPKPMMQMAPQPSAMGGGEGQKVMEKRQPVPMSDLEFAEEEMPSEIVDPRELKDAIKQTTDMKRELNRFVGQLKRTPNEAASQKIKELMGKLNTHATTIKKEQSRDALQAFYDEQIWDEVNALRAQIELPKEIANIKKELTRAQKTITLASYKKLPLDMARVKEYLDQDQAALNEAVALMAQGDGQGAMEALQPIHEGMHPGEIMGVMMRLRDLNQQLSRVKDAEIRAEMNDLLQPILDAANEGDFREANQILNEIAPGMVKLVQNTLRAGGRSSAYDAQFTKVEALIQQKLAPPVD